MRLDLFLLADAATAADGKLFIHGGGITSLQFPSLPFVQPQLACVLRVELEPSDEGQDHDLAVQILAPDGSIMAGPAGGTIPAAEIPERPNREQQIFASAALTIANMLFESRGAYTAQVLVDGVVTGTHRLVISADDSS